MAERSEIMDALEGLAVHCRPPLMSVEDRAVWLADWCEDLAGCDIAAIRTACQRWRQGTDRKFPMAGQFLPLVRSVTVAKPDQSAIPRPWEPVSDAEYATYSVREKIRHCQIMAGHIRMKAGPMFAGGKHLAFEDMPAMWHDAQNEARKFDAEAKRLREILKDRITVDHQQGQQR